MPDITASDGSVYKPTITYTFKRSSQDYSEESGKIPFGEIPDVTDIMLNYEPGQTVSSYAYAAKFVVDYNSTPAKLDINFVDSETGKIINSQTYNGNVGQKVDQSILNLPQNYAVVSSNLPSSLAETNTATVKVVKTGLPTISMVQNDVNKVADSVITVNDARNNAKVAYAIHYKSDGKTIAPDTRITMKFYRDYTIDNATNKKTIGKWQYVAGSMTQSGTPVTGIGEPGDAYNSVDGFDSFNFWLPFSAKIDGYSTSYSGVTASLSIPNSDGYIIDNLNIGTDVDYTRSMYFTVNVIDQDTDKVIASQKFDNFGNGNYRKIQAPNGIDFSHYYSIGSSSVDGVTFAASYWEPFSDANADWTYPNVKWTDDAFDNLYGKTLNIYVKDKTQYATVTYIDDTSDRNLEIKKLSGSINGDSGYNTKDDIQKYLDKGYELVSDDTNGKNVICNNKDHTVHLKHGMTSVPDGTKLSDEDLKLVDKDFVGAKQSYNETYDIVYQGNIPDNLKPTDIHKVIHYTHEVDDKGNIGYWDRVTGKLVLNPWVHDVQSLPAVDVPDITASDGSIYKPIITYTFKRAAEEDPEESGQLDEIFDVTDIMLNYDPAPMERGCYAAKFVVTYNSTPAKLNINFVDSETGSTIGTQIYNGNVGQKVDQSIVNVPQDYVFVSCDLPSSLAETNTATVKVVKKEISTGDVANADKLPTKNVIIYKDKDGNVVGTQDVNGKTGDKVTPNIPDGYWSDNTADLTIPDNGVIEVSVVKKEISTGDVTQTDTLPTKNVIIYKDKDGNVVGTQDIDGKTGDKVTSKIPDGYWSDNTTDLTIPENGIIEVSVVKKEISTGDVTQADTLPTKNVIIYKDKDGNVVGTQDVDGKAGDKVTPKIPDGYWSDNTADVTIPENGIIEVSVVKKEISTGDVTHADVLPTVDHVSGTPLIQPEEPVAQVTDKSNVLVNNSELPVISTNKVHEKQLKLQKESPIIENTSVATGSPRMHERVFSDKISENKPTGDVKVNTKTVKISEDNQLPQTGTKNGNYAVLSGILMGITGLLELLGSSFSKNKRK